MVFDAAHHQGTHLNLGHVAEMGSLADGNFPCVFREYRNISEGDGADRMQQARYFSDRQYFAVIDVEIPERLAAFMKGTKKSVPMSKEFKDFKAFLMK